VTGLAVQHSSGFAGNESVSSRDFLFIGTCFIISSPLSVVFLLQLLLA
jgi:hypothetical protein